MPSTGYPAFGTLYTPVVKILRQNKWHIMNIVLISWSILEFFCQIRVLCYIKVKVTYPFVDFAYIVVVEVAA